MPNINRLQPIWAGLARSNRHQTYICDADVTTFARRMDGEGPEFYSRGLARLRTDCFTGLETGRLVVQGRFGKKRGSSLPSFLYGAWSRVFDDSGTRRADIDVGAVASLNQLLAVYTKLEGGHTPESEIEVIKSFLHTEEEIRNTSIQYDKSIKNLYTNSGYACVAKVSQIIRDARSRVCQVLAGSDPREIQPQHGSGASACGTPVRERYRVPRYIEKIDKVWPMDSYYFTGPNGFCDRLDEFIAAPQCDPCAKVLIVPKDARGPRLISCEPAETMWIQQGLMAELYSVLEAHPMTRGSVIFTDQAPNQQAARLGSLHAGFREEVHDEMFEHLLEYHIDARDTRDTVIPDRIKSKAERRGQPLATLDLKDASDRLRLDLVQQLFPENWVEALEACRSTHTRLPDGTKVPLSKHAPMGSAVCFPVMALSIWSLLTAVLPFSEHKFVKVYGDDIIVPQHFAEAAMEVLEAVGLRVNRNKSFWRGPFRESCGKEYCNGIDVTASRLRAYPHNDVGSRMKLIAFANNLFWQDGEEHAWLHNLIRDWYGPNQPQAMIKFGTSLRFDWDSKSQKLKSVTTSENSLPGVLLVGGRANNSGLRARWNARLQRREYRIAVPEARTVKYDADDWSQVLRSLVSPRIAGPSFGTDALAKRVRYKYQWVHLQS